MALAPTKGNRLGRLFAARAMVRVRADVSFRQGYGLHALAAALAAHRAVAGSQAGHREFFTVEVGQGFEAVQQTTALGQDRFAAGVEFA